MSSHRDVHGLNGAQDVPGTVLLEESECIEEADSYLARLADASLTERDNKDHIVLQPVPTDDPDDPLVGLEYL